MPVCRNRNPSRRHHLGSRPFLLRQAEMRAILQRAKLIIPLHAVLRLPYTRFGTKTGPGMACMACSGGFWCAMAQKRIIARVGAD